MTIREIRKTVGMTQVEFAKAVGCKQSTVSLYESGARKPTAAIALRMVKLVGLGKEAAFDLLGGEEGAVSGEPRDS